VSDIPRYLVSRSAMTAWRDNGMLTDQIGMVTYADHLAAVAAAQREGANQGYLNGVATSADNSYKQGQSDCKATHAVMGLKEITRIAAEGYEQGQRDAHSEFLTTAALEACGPEDPRYAKGQRDERERLAKDRTGRFALVRADERLSIRKAVEALAIRTHDLTEDWRAAVLAVIDGEAL
jgi:hypothetical protein